MADILAIDVGTTTFKAGVFDPELRLKAEASRTYQIRLYDRVKAEIDPEQWWGALRECCGQLGKYLSDVDVLSLAVTTPGLVAMNTSGDALFPAILFLDGRSHAQARDIRRRLGDAYFLEEACNLPVSGGSSLASILWLRDEMPTVWKAAAKFGHCNTYMVKRLTGRWAIDPSTTSITGLYGTARHDMTWLQPVLDCAELPEEKLPPLIPSHAPVDRILPQVAVELGLPHKPVVLCGGNDAVLAALSAGLREPGEISTVHGTCDITNVCVDRPVRSPNFNVRCHVLPNRWVTFFVLNTGGKALEWYRSVFCRDMTEDQFFTDYLPHVLGAFLDDPEVDALEAQLPVYVPYLQGSRYSLEQLTAGFSGLTLQTTREMILLSIVRGNLTYDGENLKEVAGVVRIRREVMTTGGLARVPGFMRAKRRWAGDFDYRFQDQSSLRGAAILGQMAMQGGNA